MQLFRVLPSLLLKTSKDGECPALVDSLFSCLLAAEERIFSMYLVWTSPVYIYIVVFPSCATMKSPTLPSGWLHHRYWRALPGPPRSALIRLSKPCILRIQLPTISLASADLAQFPDAHSCIPWPGKYRDYLHVSEQFLCTCLEVFPS